MLDQINAESSRSTPTQSCLGSATSAGYRPQRYEHPGARRAIQGFAAAPRIRIGDRPCLDRLRRSVRCGPSEPECGCGPRHHRQTPGLALASVPTTHGGDVVPGFRPQSRVIPPVVVAAWWVSGRPLAATLQLGAWGAAGLSTVVKSIVRRPRPLPPAVAVAVSSLGGTSFPSGHVLTYVVFYGFLAHLVALHARPTPVRRAGVASLVGC